MHPWNQNITVYLCLLKFIINQQKFRRFSLFEIDLFFHLNFLRLTFSTGVDCFWTKFENTRWKKIIEFDLTIRTDNNIGRKVFFLLNIFWIFFWKILFLTPHNRLGKKLTWQHYFSNLADYVASIILE